MNRIVNNIQLTRNLTYMLKILRTSNQTVIFLKYVVILIFLMGFVIISYNQVCNQTLSIQYIKIIMYKTFILSLFFFFQLIIFLRTAIKELDNILSYNYPIKLFSLFKINDRTTLLVTSTGSTGPE